MTLLNYEDLKRLGIDASKTNLWRMERQGRFPRRIRLSYRKIAWDANEIQEWLQARADARFQK